MTANDRRRGVNTLEYERFHSNFASIVDNIQDILPEVAAKALGEKLIAKSNVSEASNLNDPSGVRASNLVLILLCKIEHNADVFSTVIQILKSITGLETLVETLELPGSELDSSPGASGSNTPKYNVVRGHFYPLVLNFEQDIARLAAKLFEKKLISNTNYEHAANTHQPLFDRCSALLRQILKKIELDQKWYDVFVTVLSDTSMMRDIARELTNALEKEEDSSNTSQNVPLLPLRKRQHSRVVSSCGRRHSDSDILWSKCDTSEIDSGLLESSLYVDDDQLLEADELGGECETPVEATTMTDSVLAVDSSYTSFVATLVALPSEKDLRREQNLQQPIRYSSDGASLLPSCFISNAWNLELESTYLKSENKQQASELCSLKQKVERLKEEQVISAKKLKEQGDVVSQKDGIIASLEKECAEKDKHVKELLKNKAKMEKTIEDFESKCHEAGRKQEENEEEIQAIHKSYKARIDELLKTLEEVLSREKEAQIDLANAKSQLLEALLEKEREISKLREEYHKQERIKFKLQLNERNLRRESLLKDNKLLQKEKELAEEKEKRAQDVAKHADEKRRMSEHKIEELEEELRMLKFVKK